LKKNELKKIPFKKMGPEKEMGVGQKMVSLIYLNLR